MFVSDNFSEYTAISKMQRITTLGNQVQVDQRDCMRDFKGPLLQT